MAEQGQIFVQDEVSTRIGTRPLLDESEPCLLVETLEWDSGFRGSGLQVGDRIVAMNGVAVAQLAREAAEQKNPSLLVGQYSEPNYWERKGAKEGAPVSLTLRRRHAPHGWQTLEAHGILRAKRSYRDAKNSPTLWADGPSNYERDGFNDSWPTWYEAFQQQITAALCDRWRRSSYGSRYELSRFLEHAARMTLLDSKYPGPFAKAMREDYAAAVASAQGALYTLSETDLAYRRADDERIADVAALGQAQFSAACAAVTLLPAFPAPHPIHTPHEERVGQYVLLENIPTQQWINDGDASFLLAGSTADGWYALSVDAAPAQRMFMALRRYQKLVNPNLRERYTVLARILPEARIVV